MELKFIFLICTFVFLGLGILLFEKSRFNAKSIALIAILSAICGISRVPFASIPNVQPTTFLIIVIAYIFGPGIGFMIGIIATLVSNMFLGQGIWTLWQMLAWGICGFISGLIGKILRSPNRLFLSIYAFIWGFIFDYIMNLWHWLFFIHEHNLKSFILVYASSFYFDLAHAIGNVIFMYFFGLDLINVLKRFYVRLK